MVCAIALPSHSVKPIDYQLSIDPTRFGMKTANKVDLTDLETGAKLGSFSGKVTYSGTVPSWGLVLLKLAVAA
eukprot:COSAG05_NODE_1741_length_4161_cov_1.817824_3_plen_73_part_00